jgi:hypothetical protein
MRPATIFTRPVGPLHLLVPGSFQQCRLLRGCISYGCRPDVLLRDKAQLLGVRHSTCCKPQALCYKSVGMYEQAASVFCMHRLLSDSRITMFSHMPCYPEQCLQSATQQLHSWCPFSTCVPILPGVFAWPMQREQREVTHSTSQERDSTRKKSAVNACNDCVQAFPSRGARLTPRSRGHAREEMFDIMPRITESVQFAGRRAGSWRVDHMQWLGGALVALLHSNYRRRSRAEAARQGSAPWPSC